METSILSKFGLTPNETKVYTTLLKTGSALAGEITQKSGVHRRNVYDAIERLMEKGLVSSVVINNKKWFKAANPKRFLGIIEEEKSGLETLKRDFSKLLPQLEAMTKLHVKRKQEIMYFKGKEGIKTVYNDILNEGKDYVGYGSGDWIDRTFKKEITHFVKEKMKRKIHCKLIYNERSRYIIRNPLSKYRYLPEEYNSPVCVRVYGDKVAIMLQVEESPFAIIIQNKVMADAYRKRWRFIWDMAKP